MEEKCQNKESILEKTDENVNNQTSSNDSIISQEPIINTGEMKTDVKENRSRISKISVIEEELPENEEDSSNTEDNPRRVTDIKDNDIEGGLLKRCVSVKRRFSIINGVPKNLDDIEKLESPLYRVKTKSNFSLSNKLSRKSVANRSQTIKKPQNNVEEVEATVEIKTFNSNIETIFQVINCIIRYSIVQLPFCFKILGIINGSGIMCLIGLMSIYSVIMIVEIHLITGYTSFSQFAYNWWGTKGKIMVLCLNMFGAFGSCLSYIIICLKILPPLARNFFGDNILSYDMFWSFLIGWIMLYYCIKKNVSGIGSAAKVGVFAISLFLSLVVFDFLLAAWTEKMPYDFNLKFSETKLNNDYFSCIACIILSFSYHPYAFSIFECLQVSTSRNMKITATIGIFISLFVYVLIGSIGYIMYGEILTDSLIDSMKLEDHNPDTLIILENISYVVNVIMCFPITFAVMKNYLVYSISMIATKFRDCYVRRTVRYFLTKKIFPSNENDKTKNEIEMTNIEEEKHENHNNHMDHHDPEKDQSHNNHHDMVIIPTWLQRKISIAFVILIIFMANKFQNTKVVFTFIGATYSNINVFILPALFYFKFANTEKKLLNYVLPIFFIIFGVVGLITCVTSNIISLASGQAH